MLELLAGIFDFFLHIDVHLGEIISAYGVFTYVFLFFIIFAETGFVFIPFLPGDSLLFAAGTFAAIGSLEIAPLLVLLFFAAFLGDTANYWIGRFYGQKIVDDPRIPINQEHLNKAQEFYRKHGGKTIFLARFVPIIRTFAPFIAGIGKMEYKKFFYYNILGGLAWTSGLTLLGYMFGNIPQVRENFSIVIIAIIFISLYPVVSEIVRSRRRKI